MLVEKITSRQNPLVKRMRRVRAGDERHLIFLEGVRLIEDALSAHAHFEAVAFTASTESNTRGSELLASLDRVPCRGAHVSPQVMEAIAGTESPQGIAAIINRPYFELKDLPALKPRLLVIADQLQDPGNLGTIIRTAEAAGASALIGTRYTVDPFNPKALRASMGSALRLPIVTDAKSEEVAKLCRELKIKIVATRARAERPPGVIEDAAEAPIVRPYTQANLGAPLAFILGQEGGGITSESSAAADEFVYIPMASTVESLNVATAAAILLYEAARQRRFPFNKREHRK
jgi:TrmH family RNA methyltransferase